jgi:hypothetical protein
MQSVALDTIEIGASIGAVKTGVAEITEAHSRLVTQRIPVTVATPLLDTLGTPVVVLG